MLLSLSALMEPPDVTALLLKKRWLLWTLGDFWCCKGVPLCELVVLVCRELYRSAAACTMHAHIIHIVLECTLYTNNTLKHARQYTPTTR